MGTLYEQKGNKQNVNIYEIRRKKWDFYVQSSFYKHRINGCHWVQRQFQPVNQLSQKIRAAKVQCVYCTSGANSANLYTCLPTLKVNSTVNTCIKRKNRIYFIFYILLIK